VNELTPLQSEIVMLLADGHTAKEIARSMSLPPRTVERHVDLCRHKWAL